MENIEGSIITATNSTVFAFDNVSGGIETGLQGDDQFLNQGNSEFHGAVSTTFIFGGANDEFLNQTGALFQVDGVNTLDFGSGDDDMINEQGATFTATGTSTNVVFGLGDDDLINRQGANFSASGATVTFSYGDGQDRFINDNGGDFQLNVGGTGLNTMDFGANLVGSPDSFLNDDAYFRADGTNSIVNLEFMTNDWYGDIEFNGTTTIGADNTTGLTTLTNSDDAYFEMDGTSTINFTAGGNTFDNIQGAQFASYGTTLLDFGDGVDVVNNTQGGSSTPAAVPAFSRLPTSRRSMHRAAQPT